MPNSSERFQDLARKAVTKYLYEMVGAVRPAITLLTEYTAGSEALETQFAFQAEIDNGQTLLAVVDPVMLTVKVTDVNAGNDSTRTYKYMNIFGILVIP
jgi:hypothetical protein